jgi:hypothetical protein
VLKNHKKGWKSDILKPKEAFNAKNQSPLHNHLFLDTYQQKDFYGKICYIFKYKDVQNMINKRGKTNQKIKRRE